MTVRDKEPGGAAAQNPNIMTGLDEKSGLRL